MVTISATGARQDSEKKSYVVSPTRGGVDTAQEVKVAQSISHEDDIRVALAGAEENPYDELSVSESTPAVTGNAVYNFIPSNFRTFTDGTGSVVAEDGVFKCNTGTTIYSYGTLQSFRSVNYKTGQGASFRFSARFPSIAALTWSGAGAIALGNEMSFGYDGLDFGVWHRYGGLAEVRNLQITTPAGGAETGSLTVNGVLYSIPLTNGTVQFNAREITDYIEASVPGYTAEQIDDDIIIAAETDGPKAGVWSFASDGTAVGNLTQTKAGITKTSDHIPTASWNGDEVVGLDPSKGNNYKIIYKNGFGDIQYYIGDTNHDHFILVHTVRWTNTKTTPNLNNPSMRCGCYAASIGSITDISVECAYLAAFLSGKDSKTRNPRAFDNTKSIATTLINILTIRNKRIYNDKFNQIEVEPVYLTLANDGNKSAIFELVANPTVSGVTNFQEVGNNLISEYELDGIEVSGGRLLAAFTVAKASSTQINLKDFNIRIPPTLRLVVAGKMASGAAADLSASLTWYEDV